MNKIRLLKHKGQNIIEFSILLGLIIAAFVAMQVYLKRGVQASIKIAADQLGEQEKGAPYTDKREGAVQEGTSSSHTASSRTVTQDTARRAVKSEQTSESETSTESLGQEDGWYYIKNGNEWEKRRKNEE